MVNTNFMISLHSTVYYTTVNNHHVVTISRLSLSLEQSSAEVSLQVQMAGESLAIIQDNGYPAVPLMNCAKQQSRDAVCAARRFVRISLQIVPRTIGELAS